MRYLKALSTKLAGTWAAVKEVQLSYNYLPMMENRMEKSMEHEMETGVIHGVKELQFRYRIGHV